MGYDDDGQMTLDYLAGLVIFLMAILYIVAAIPGIFMPYQNNAVDLSSVVYRTSALLVEDPGYYIPTGSYLGFTQWEATQNNTNNLSRIGLASSKYTPGIISLKKINALDVNVSYEESRKRLGLLNTVPYDYSLEITWIDRDGNVKTMTKPNATETSGPVGANVESIQRAVYVDEGLGILVNSTESYNNTSDALVEKLIFNVMKNQTQGNISITIPNSTGGTIFGIALFNETLPFNPGEYAVYVNGASRNLPTSINVGDDVYITINGSFISSRMGTRDTVDVTLITSMVCFRKSWNDRLYTYDETNPRYWTIYDKGVLKLKVWS
jgi:hypothetical protein